MTRIPHPRPESAGDRALLVVVDSRGAYADRAIVDETVLIPLRHFGFPYRRHDLAAGPLTRELLAGCAAVVLAQDRLGGALSPGEGALLAAAVTELGLGLVNFDGGDLSRYPPEVPGLLGLQVDRRPAASDRLVFPRNDHFITWTQPGGQDTRLKRPVTVAPITRLGRQAVELAQAVLGKEQLIFARHHVPGSAYEPGQLPALVAGTSGQGRVVQFAFSPRLWHREFFGHALGLDGLFWRAIVWAARKPFAATMMPPYVTLRVDDARGRHDFGYVEVMNQHGQHPLVSCFVDQVPAELAPTMRALWQRGRVDWDAHALDYYRLIPFDFGVGEYSDAQLAETFGRVDAWYAGLGVPPPRTAYFHWGEVGRRALPYLKARGRTYVYCPYHLGQPKWERVFPDWWPYGLNSLFYDYHPEDPDFYNVGGGLPRHLMEPDVLTGCTVWGGESPRNDPAKAAQRAALAVRLALDSGFFAEVTTHEQKLAVLGLDEIDRWLTLLEGEVARYPLRRVGHENAADYTRARDETWIAGAVCPDGRTLHVDLAGRAATPLELAVFTADDEVVQQRWEPAPAFDGACRLTL